MWYAANLLFKRVRDSQNDADSLWEESIRLVSAGGEEEAQRKATRLGEAEHVAYRTSSGGVEWVFDRVERVYSIEQETLSDGTEIFSRFLRGSEVASLLIPFEEDDA